MAGYLIGRAFGAALTVLAAGLGGTAAAAATAGAATAPAAAKPAPAPNLPGEKAVFASADNDGLRHLPTGFVCPASLGGVMRTDVNQERGANNDGSGYCTYGANADGIYLMVSLSPVEDFTLPQALEISFEMMDLPKGLPSAPQPLPLGQPAGPELGYFVAAGPVTAGSWVGFRNGWWMTVAGSYRNEHAEQARTVGAEVFKGFQTASPTAR